jgi:hypothetical protein
MVDRILNCVPFFVKRSMDVVILVSYNLNYMLLITN